MKDIEQNVPLDALTTFKIGGAARYFARVVSVEKLRQALEFAKKEKLPFFVIGEGSNTLVPEYGYAGLVIRNEIRGIKIKEEGGAFTLECGAGENWDAFVSFTIFHKLYGLENLSYIPGSVGAAPVQNIGAYGAEVKETITSVEVFDAEAMSLKKLSTRECRFAYRDSIFKHKKGKNFVITRVFFRLSKRGKVNIGYKDLKEHFKARYSSEITPVEVREAVVAIRKNKLPDWKTVATAGSFFKNPFVSKNRFERLKKKYPEMPGFSEKGMDGKVKIPLAWILDKMCHLRGFREGNIGLYVSQPLTVVNFGGACFNEVERFANMISKKIKEKTEIEVEWEVRVLK